MKPDDLSGDTPSRSGVADVLRTVIESGREVIGLEGFKLDTAIYAQADLIFDVDRRPESALDVLVGWPEDVWVDVTLRRLT